MSMEIRREWIKGSPRSSKRLHGVLPTDRNFNCATMRRTKCSAVAIDAKTYNAAYARSVCEDAVHPSTGFVFLSLFLRPAMYSACPRSTSARLCQALGQWIMRTGLAPQSMGGAVSPNPFRLWGAKWSKYRGSGLALKHCC